MKVVRLQMGGGSQVTGGCEIVGKWVEVVR